LAACKANCLIMATGIMHTRISRSRDGAAQSREGVGCRASGPDCATLHPGYGIPLCRASVNPSPRKYSTLPKFGFVVCVAHPGSSLRGDRASSRYASRVAVDAAASCARGAGRAGSPCEPVATCRRAAPKSGEASWRSRMSCVRQNRVVLAVVATVKSSRRCERAQPGRLHHPIREAREARTNSAPGRARHKPSDHCAGKAE